MSYNNSFDEKECPSPTVTPSSQGPVPITIESCQDAIQVNLGEIKLTSLGRVIQLDATLKKVCPNKRVAVAVELTEVDSKGNEYARGVKYFTVPAHKSACCSNVELKCIKFIVPEDLDVTGNTDSICNARNFNARIDANYIDSDSIPCDTKIITPQC